MGSLPPRYLRTLSAVDAVLTVLVLALAWTVGREAAAAAAPEEGNGLQTSPFFWILVAFASLTWLQALGAAALWWRATRSATRGIWVTAAELWAAPVALYVAVVLVYAGEGLWTLGIAAALGLGSAVAALAGVTGAIRLVLSARRDTASGAEDVPTGAGQPG